MIETVVKRDGTITEFDADKLNKWAEFAAGVGGVDWSDMALKAYRKCFDGCTTRDLHKAMIDSCVEKEDHNHLLMAGRLLLGSIYKEAFGGADSIPTLHAFYHEMVDSGHWTDMDYTGEELDFLDSHINHGKDESYNYTSLRQMVDKYMIKDRITDTTFESPQFMFMGMAMQNMERMPKSRRLEDVIKLYSYLRDMKINAPTPMLVNMRTRHRGYASCCVYTTEDSAKSLAAGDHIAYMMTCASAGIGGYLKTRSKGDGVRSNSIKHMGKLPYLNAVQSMVHANLQSSRGGAATMYYTVLDPEIDDLLKLKNPKTVAEKRIKNIDYALSVNHMFAEYVAKNKEWMLISYSIAPDLHEAFFSADTDKFRELYAKYDNGDYKKTYINARKIARDALEQGAETGRIYLFVADEVNRHTPFKDKIYSSNLCLEIALPTKGYTDIMDLYSKDPIGEIGLCSLASIVAGRVNEYEYEDVAYYTALMIDNVIEIMEYPFSSLEVTAKARRSIGVGITNLAYALAKQGLKYSSDEGKKFIHNHAERHSYYLHKASLRLAKEFGTCEWINKTKYPDGWLPIDTYNRSVDKITSDLNYDWEELRSEIKRIGGIRHSVLEAIMPVESSSQLTNTTNSIYPIRNLRILKSSGNNKNLLVAPEADELADEYEIAWDIETKHLIDLYAIIQKFTGQAISSDVYLKFENTERKVSTKKLLNDFLYMVKSGMKTRYYINSSSGVDSKKPEEVEDLDCGGGGCKL